MIYAFMYPCGTKEEMINSMVFFRDFGDIAKFLKIRKTRSIDWSQAPDPTSKECTGMILSWKSVIFEDVLFGYWTNVSLSSDYYVYQGKGNPLTISEKVSKEDCFRGVFYLDPPKLTRGLYRIDFVVGDAIDTDESSVITEIVNQKKCFVLLLVMGNKETALEEFRTLVVPKLKTELLENVTVKEVDMYQKCPAILAQNIFDEKGEWMI